MWKEYSEYRSTATEKKNQIFTVMMKNAKRLIVTSRKIDNHGKVTGNVSRDDFMSPVLKALKLSCVDYTLCFSSSPWASIH